MSVDLKYPIPDGAGGDLSTVKIEEPDLETIENVIDVMERIGLKDDAKALGIKQLRPMITALTGIPEESLKRLHFKDAIRLSEAMTPLLEGLTT